MNKKETNEAVKNVYSFLDKIDLKPYINDYKSKNIVEMMDRLEELYFYRDNYSLSLFDTVSVDEFIIYLENRYDTDFSVETEVIYKIK